MQVLRHSFQAFLAIFAAATVGGCNAESGADLLPQPAPIQISASKPPFSQPFRPALAPLEFVSFCMRYGEDCRPSGSTEVIRATAANLELIASVNRKVNAAIRPTKRVAAWRIAPADGNCNDYVVTKRHELLAKGFPSSALIINVVKTMSGMGHLVLVVKTDRDHLVLDNLSSDLLDVAETSYVWIKRQTLRDPQQWEAT